jgi:hypothetical protein
MTSERKKLHLLFFMAMFLSVSLFAFARKPAPPKQPMAAQRFKNIQVLKNLPASQLIPTMRNISASLGVRCYYCHVEGSNHTGFEKDTKPTKRIARQMLLMVMDINAREKAIHGKATCFMCHHGSAVPVTKAPMRPLL